MSSLQIKEAIREKIQTLRSVGGDSDEAEGLELDLQDSEEVIVRSYKEHPVVREIVEAFLAAGKKVEIKRCFDNATALTEFDERILYIRGHALPIGRSPKPVDHAWNCYGKFHFDLTAELALGLSLFDSYLAFHFVQAMDLVSLDV